MWSLDIKITLIYPQNLLVCRQASRWTFHAMKIIQKKNEVLTTSKAKAAFQQLPGG
jgi:hypothetical protein